MDVKEQVAKYKKDRWFDVAFSIEVLAITKEVADDSLDKHIKKLSEENGVLVYETSYRDAIRVEKPLRDIQEAYSKVVNMRLLIKNLSVLMHVVVLYGPSSIEVLGPGKKEIELGEVQHVANNLASIVHQFAAAGVGGIVITPERKDR